MNENFKNSLLLALMGVAIGIAGIIGYYQQIDLLFYTCTALCVAQLLLVIFFEALKDTTFPFLAACLLIGYFMTDDILNGLCYGICLHYATTLVYVGLLFLIPFQFVLIIVPIVSILSFFLHAEHLFLTTAVYCTIYFITKHLRGKNPSFAMDVFLWCVAFGVGFLQMRDTDAYQSVKIIKGLLWGGSAYYIVGILYSWYRLCVKHDSIQDIVGNIE